MAEQETKILEWKDERWKVLGQAGCRCHWVIESLGSGKRELVDKKCLDAHGKKEDGDE